VIFAAALLDESGTDTRGWAQAKVAAYGEVPRWLGHVFVFRGDEETNWPDRPAGSAFERIQDRLNRVPVSIHRTALTARLL
jgi:hypothetical protein